MIAACSQREEAVNPDFASTVAGTYPMTYYREGSQSVNLPSNGMSGKFDIKRIDMTHIHMTLTLMYDIKPEVNEVESLELKRKDKSTFEIYYGLQLVGTISPTEIEVFDISPDGTEIQIRGKRQ